MYVVLQAYMKFDRIEEYLKLLSELIQYLVWY